MIYLCNKIMYDLIASQVTKKDLSNTQLTLDGFMCKYFNDWLCLPEGTITKIRFK